MSDSYEQLSRSELVARLRELEQLVAGSQQALKAELDVHREELRAQHEELAAAQATLEATLAEYEELYDQAPLPYLTLDPYGIVVSANQTAVVQLGISKFEMLERPFVVYIDDHDMQSFLDHMRRCRASTTEVVGEVRLKTPRGSIPVLMSSRPAADDNAGPVYRTALTNLTALKEAESQIRELNATLEDRVCQRTIELEEATNALRDADRRKDDFLAMLGHELRNPLSPIRNAVELWRLMELDHPDLEELRLIIDRQVSHMARIIDDLLDVSRIVRGKITLRKAAVDLVAVARQAAADLSLEADAAQIVVETSLPSTPIMVFADQTRLAQIVSNVVQNAIKFTEPGGKILVSAARDAVSAQARLVVRDTGVGMEPQMLDRLFETFSQADRTLDRSRGGLGLGLALVKGLVELHGGTVQAASEGLGKGAKITIELPLSETAAAPHAADGQRDPNRSLKVVVIDDRQDSVVTMHRLLTKLNHKVATAVDGETGLQRARELRPDVILSDIGLPGMDGYDVAREVRRDPNLASTCLVAITGYGQLDDQQRAYEAGFNFHLTKPVGLEDLQRVLRRVDGQH